MAIDGVIPLQVAAASGFLMFLVVAARSSRDEQEVHGSVSFLPAPAC